MLSFIIIGRNEGWKLTKCLASIFDTIKKNYLTKYEIIYVDSNSNDDSIERAKKFNEIMIFKLTGITNAAIGRNVGAKESKGDVLFFIDGDMEIVTKFLAEVYNEEQGLKYDFVSGQFIDYNYDYSGKLLSKNEYFPLEHDTIDFTTGGLFLIKRKIWVKVGGMRIKFRRSQDIDLGIRLSKHGVYLVRKKEQLAIHHTIPYHNNQRIWKMLWDGSELYRGVLLRDNFFNINQWRLFLRENYTSVFLLFTILTYLVVDSNLFLLIYLISVVARVLQKNVKVLQKLSLLIYFFIRDVSTWLSFIFFWPSSTKQTAYIRIVN